MQEVKINKTFFDVPNPPMCEARAAFFMAFKRDSLSKMDPLSEGPMSILEASGYVELYDEELKCQPADRGIHTVSKSLCLNATDGTAEIRPLLEIFQKGLFPVIIGNNRIISAALMKTALLFDGSVEPVLLSGSIPEEGFWSSSKNFLRNKSVNVIGLKSPEKKAQARVQYLSTSRALMKNPDFIPWNDLGDKVYLSIHPDFLEPAVLPVSDNIEPGGLDWWHALELLRNLFERKKVIGMDLCGHRPEKGRIIADFTLAKLLYKVMGYLLCLP